MDYNSSSYTSEIEHVGKDGRMIKIKIPDSKMQKIICNCDKINNDGKLGNPCETCKNKRY
jgi:hypothetical protein